MKVKIKDPKIWKTFIGSVVGLIDEAAFNFSPQGVKMKAMDASKISLVDFELSPKAFDEFEVKEKTIVGVKLLDLERTLSRMKSSDELILEVDTEGGHLNLIFKGASTRKLGIPLLNVEESDFPEPKLTFTAEATVKAGVLQDGLKDAKMVSEHVRFTADKEGLVMSTEADRGSTELKLSKGDEGLIALKVTQPTSSMYNVKYLEEMLGGASATDEVTLKFSTDLPLELDFKVEGGKLKFLLAPRVES